MFLETCDSTVFISTIECVSEGPEAEGSYLCLSTHHQLTQSIVDELILSLGRMAITYIGELVIIESVDSICRDGADTPISPIQK